MRAHKMTKVAVIHSAFGDIPNTVAIVDCGERTGNDALEYAYFRTQNLEGSWSKGATFEWDGATHDNGDYSPDVTVMAALHEGKDGKTYGLRSTSVGDQMLLGTVKYEVANFGFKEVDFA
jgi:hypothetical protein